ncbi:MAG TPA: hypothetical protein VN711_02415 [Candidatus Saccharimonadales bacterium]|nr:hypothetical protein [Candidatus Saccharimonadales bacterium]
MLDTNELYAWEEEYTVPSQGKKVCMVSRHAEKHDERENEEKKDTPLQAFL